VNYRRRSRWSGFSHQDQAWNSRNQPPRGFLEEFFPTFASARGLAFGEIAMEEPCRLNLAHIRLNIPASITAPMGTLLDALEGRLWGALAEEDEIKVFQTQVRAYATQLGAHHAELGAESLGMRLLLATAAELLDALDSRAGRNPLLGDLEIRLQVQGLVYLALYRLSGAPASPGAAASASAGALRRGARALFAGTLLAPGSSGRAVAPASMGPPGTRPLPAAPRAPPALPGPARGTSSPAAVLGPVQAPPAATSWAVVARRAGAQRARAAPAPAAPSSTAPLGMGPAPGAPGVALPRARARRNLSATASAAPAAPPPPPAASAAAAAAGSARSPARQRHSTSYLLRGTTDTPSARVLVRGAPCPAAAPTADAQLSFLQRLFIKAGFPNEATAAIQSHDVRPDGAIVLAFRTEHQASVFLRGKVARLRRLQLATPIFMGFYAGKGAGPSTSVDKSWAAEVAALVAAECGPAAAAPPAPKPRPVRAARPRAPALASGSEAPVAPASLAAADPDAMEVDEGPDGDGFGLAEAGAAAPLNGGGLLGEVPPQSDLPGPPPATPARPASRPAAAGEPLTPPPSLSPDLLAEEDALENFDPADPEEEAEVVQILSGLPRTPPRRGSEMDSPGHPRSPSYMASRGRSRSPPPCSPGALPMIHRGRGQRLGHRGEGDSDDSETPSPLDSGYPAYVRKQRLAAATRQAVPSGGSSPELPL
jgi:hypothetical protein